MEGEQVHPAFPKNDPLGPFLWGIGTEQKMVLSVEHQAEFFGFPRMPVPIGPVVQDIVPGGSPDIEFWKGHIGDLASIVVMVEGIEDPAPKGIGCKGFHCNAPFLGQVYGIPHWYYVVIFLQGSRSAPFLGDLCFLCNMFVGTVNDFQALFDGPVKVLLPIL